MHADAFYYIVYFLIFAAVNDYTPVIALPVTFSAGSVVNSESCFDVDLASDTLVEGNEFFFLGMVPASPLVTVDDNLDEATVTILDLDRKPRTSDKN